MSQLLVRNSSDTVFEDYIFAAFASEIMSWDSEFKADIYALGLLIHFEDQDLRYGTVGLVYNTHQHYQNEIRSLMKKCPTLATSKEKTEAAAAEVKWHFDYWVQFAHWPQDNLALVAKGHSPYPDPVGVVLRREWLEGRHLWFTNEEEEADFDRCLEIGGRIEEAFLAVCVRAASRLHTEGIIEKAFGHSVPVVFHDYPYEPAAAQYTHEANPPGLAEEFERYVLVVRHS